MDENVLYHLVGERIRKARSRAKLSQAKLALALGLSRTSVVNIEAGRQKAPLHVLWQVAEILGTEAALLIPNQEEYQEQKQPIALDNKIIEQIETAANGNSSTKQALYSFITKIKAKNQRTL
jgi:transcriptional regulator with XRE-family HTH domain